MPIDKSGRIRSDPEFWWYAGCSQGLIHRSAWYLDPIDLGHGREGGEGVDDKDLVALDGY